MKRINTIIPSKFLNANKKTDFCGQLLRKNIQMKKILIFVSIIGLAFACGGEATSGSNNGEATAQTTSSKPKKKGADGEKTYKTYCVVCHGVYGDMGASGAHDLTTSKLTLEERIEVIEKGRNTMTPFKGLLSEEKIKAVAEYTLKLKKKEE